MGAKLGHGRNTHAMADIRLKEAGTYRQTGVVATRQIAAAIAAGKFGFGRSAGGVCLTGLEPWGVLPHPPTASRRVPPSPRGRGAIEYQIWYINSGRSTKLAPLPQGGRGRNPPRSGGRVRVGNALDTRVSKPAPSLSLENLGIICYKPSRRRAAPDQTPRSRQTES
jgi:hypothetical protein